MRDKSCCRHTSRLWCLLQACVWARWCQLPRRSQSLKKEYCLWTFKAWNVELEDVFKEQISLVWHLGNYFKNSYPWFSSGCSFKITDSRAEHNVHVASILLFLKKKKPSSSFSNLRLPQGCTLTFITTVCTVPFFFFFFSRNDIKHRRYRQFLFQHGHFVNIETVTYRRKRICLGKHLRTTVWGLDKEREDFKTRQMETNWTSHIRETQLGLSVGPLLAKWQETRYKHLQHLSWRNK